jgi:hypothetical protein
LQQVAKVVQSIRALDTKPHVGLLMHIMVQNEHPRHLVTALEQAWQPNQVVSCLADLGVEADKVEAKLDELRQALLRSFPKQTSPGDKHSYVQFARAPPGGRTGTVHVGQLFAWLEPPLGASWPSVMAVRPSCLHVVVHVSGAPLQPLHVPL